MNIKMFTCHRPRWLPACVMILCFSVAGASAAPGLDLAEQVEARTALDKGLDYLAKTQQPGGGWDAFGQSHIGVSSLALKALLQSPRYGREHPVCKKGLAFVRSFRQPDGGIYDPSGGHRNYHTSVALMALAAARDESLKDEIRGCQEYLRKSQWDSGEGHERSSSWYGGAGYGRHKRPDLSNTQMMLEALHQSGLPADDPVYQKAMVFISRSQMLDETNDQPLADGAKDGGFIYTPVGAGESKAGTETDDTDTRLRSYGSMTYAGFKSMLYAEIDRDDPRVVSAVNWIRRNYTLDQNPNMPGKQSREGLYYYYHTFARANDAWGEEEIEDDRGVPHRWRAELAEALVKRQRDDGSWVNEEDRWYEGNPHLVTAYAALALQTALAK